MVQGKARAYHCFTLTEIDMRNEREANLALVPMARPMDATLRVGAHFAKPAPKRERKAPAPKGFISRILGRKG